MKSETWFPPASADAPRSCVYSLAVDTDEIKTIFHVAVFRDDLHCYVTLASIPAFLSIGIGIDYAGALELALRETLKVRFADWEAERVIFGVTSWLVRRENRDWRGIQRIQITESGTITKPGWLPHEVAEPILRMLEDSVPVPEMLSFPDEEV